LILKGADMLADSRLRHMQLLSGSGIVSGIDYRQKCAKIQGIEHDAALW
jgi:hypothetical protein